MSAPRFVTLAQIDAETALRCLGCRGIHKRMEAKAGACPHCGASEPEDVARVCGETGYRRGYSHGIAEAVRALERGATLAELTRYGDQIYEWRLDARRESWAMNPPPDSPIRRPRRRARRPA